MKPRQRKAKTDEQTLTALLGEQNFPALAEALEDIARHDLGKVQIWKYREFYRALPDDELRKSPILCVTLALIGVLAGDTKLSDSYVDMLKNMQGGLQKQSVQYKNIQSYLYYLAVALPQQSRENPLKALRAVERAIKNGADVPRLSITANRPSIINGGRDFTGYGKQLKTLRLPLIAMTHVLHGEQGVGVPDVAIAEMLYQKDEMLDALVLLVATIPFIERTGDICTLFAAMFLQTEIMILSGQAPSAKPMLDELHEKILAEDADYLLPNLNAIYAWGALYDGDFELVKQWMQDDAPSELGEFCTLDRFQYFVKLRVYLMQGKHVALVGLAERLKPTLLAFDRKMEQCELYLLLAMSYYAEGDRVGAFALLDEAIPLAEEYRYDRLIGDEGTKMFLLLREYAKERNKNSYLDRVVEIAKKTGLLYPDYLKSRKDSLPSLTPTELDVLRLLAAERTNAEIADYMSITLRTVKFHTGNILSKLSAGNRGQAVKIARESGII